MKKILLSYFSFVIACIAVIAAFITSTTYIQLAVAILLYPLLVFFAYKALPLRKRHAGPEKPQAEEVLQAVQPEEKSEIQKTETVGISDIDKRVFLKLIGSAGLFLFFFSIFNKKAEGLFFKNLPGQVTAPGQVALEDISGNKIDPSQNHPTDGYNICEIDDEIVSFYGYINQDGAWYVMKVDPDTGSFRYSKGTSDFPGNWSNRENLDYDYFNNTF